MSTVNTGDAAPSAVPAGNLHIGKRAKLRAAAALLKARSKIEPILAKADPTHQPAARRLRAREKAAVLRARARGKKLLVKEDKAEEKAERALSVQGPFESMKAKRAKRKAEKALKKAKKAVV
ncbi:hypothetical protein W97_01951 [Coniosporium apollinis CBS 100218]|uniref:Uncharacterized protein n=1 Tax=Coniosporium apollinis (strain CBS 100218) TaxID=1168221 RepID=R7YLC6_CONA1|nr:uncharacterized protein W97_01951 [Coniosporium apollinis CBS 100218]EON62727.1 hypothetical protein W97_01951 [Coniosporium apollinis CBS 100218]